MAAKGELEAIDKIYLDPLFNRTLKELRALGGPSAVAAAKADAFIDLLLGRSCAGGRERFRFTRNGEYRIKNCRKVDLGCGYRIVCIQKDRRIVLLYIGSHDDCFRWIDRNRTEEYDLEAVADEAWIRPVPACSEESAGGGREEDVDRLDELFEEQIMSRIDDSILRKVFAGLVVGKA